MAALIDKKIIIAANTSWYLQNFRLNLIRELQSRGNEVIALAPFDETSQGLQEQGMRFIHLAMERKGLNPFTDLGLLKRMYQIYKHEKPDYVFHNTIKPVIYGSIAARYAEIAHVSNMVPGLGYVFIGQELVHQTLRPLIKRMYTYALKSSDRVFFQNPDDRDYFVRQKMVRHERSVVTFGSGVDIEYFKSPTPKPPSDECFFLLSGRLLWDKGVGEFVEAARLLKPAHPRARFQLLGKLDKGNPSGISEAALNEWIQAGIVEYLGETNDVRQFIQSSDVAVLPSYREGVPKAVLEAMAMGKPVITTDAPGCRETVVEGVNGILVPTKNVSALQEAMRFMLMNPDRRRAMGAESRRLAEERFDVRKVSMLILDAMDSASG